MKLLKPFLFLFLGAITIQAQTVDEIINTYHENTGGEAWNKVENVTMHAKVNQGGMEIPIKVVQLKDGKQATIINFQGKEIKQGVFDGETLWGTNFMTMKAEKSDKEATDNMKINSKDFPDSFRNYKEKGYTVELIGKEEVDGTECFKVKLTKTPLTVEGKQVANIDFYYFETENFVPIMIHKEIMSGPQKGKTSEVKFSDYQEVDGVYFPFSMSNGVKGGFAQAMTIDKIEINQTVDDSIFKFPVDAENSSDKK